MIKGHWQPEPIDKSTFSTPNRFGLIESKKSNWEQYQNDLIFKNNKSVYKSTFEEDSKLTRISDYPKRFVRNSLSKSTALFPVNVGHKDLDLRGRRVVNVVPDIVEW